MTCYSGKNKEIFCLSGFVVAHEKVRWVKIESFLFKYLKEVTDVLNVVGRRRNAEDA